MGVSLHVASLTGLPIPVALFIYAAANVVVLSFVPAALFSGDRVGSGAVAYPRVPAPWLLGLVRSRAVRVAGAGAGVAGLVAVTVAGFADAPIPMWTWLWAALVPASALAGNLWPLCSPFPPLTPRRGLRGGKSSSTWVLPDWLGIWPAVGAYLGFAFVELVSGASSRPQVTAALVVGYTVVTLTGMALFGRDEWASRCEGLTVLFSLVGRFGPVEVARDACGRVEAVWLRPWGTGLLEPQRAGWDWIVFVVLLLSTLAFDGLVTTNPWQAVAAALGPAAAPAALVAVTAAFLLAFVVFARLMLALGGARRNDLGAMTAFALTLVPIALLYHTALIWGFVILQHRPLPFRADAIWYVQLTLVVLGHAIAVYLANLRAGERFRGTRRAMLGQYPMVVLLVLYTMTSMWILTA